MTSSTPSSSRPPTGGFFRLSAGGSGGSWSTLDLGKAIPSVVAKPLGEWVNSSHQGLTVAAAEPSRHLAIQAGDKVLWRLLVRQGLYEVYFAPPPRRHATSRSSGGSGGGSSSPPTFYFGAAYGAQNAVACTDGQVQTRLELHGAFATSLPTIYAMTLDTHDWAYQPGSACQQQQQQQQRLTRGG